MLHNLPEPQKAADDVGGDMFIGGGGREVRGEVRGVQNSIPTTTTTHVNIDVPIFTVPLLDELSSSIWVVYGRVIVFYDAGNLIEKKFSTLCCGPLVGDSSNAVDEEHRRFVKESIEERHVDFVCHYACVPIPRDGLMAAIVGM